MRHTNFSNLGVPLTIDELLPHERALQRARERKGPTLTVVPSLPPDPAPVAEPPKARRPRRRKAPASTPDWRAQLEEHELPESFAPTAAPAPIIAPAPVAVAPSTPVVAPTAVPPEAPAPERVIKWNPGVRLDPASALLALGTVAHIAIGVSIAYGLHKMDQPLPVAVGLATFIVSALLALHSGLGDHTPRLRNLAIVSFTLFGLYCSTLTWRTKLGGADATEDAHNHHAALEAALFRPLTTEATTADADADSLESRFTREVEDRGGRGPVARDLDEKASSARARANALESRVQSLAPYFADVSSLTALQLYANDRDAVAAAGDLATKAGVHAPERGAYYTQPFLVPLYRALGGEAETLGAVLLSLMVEAMGAAFLYMGHHTRKP